MGGAFAKDWGYANGMIDWSPEQQEIRRVFRRFVETEVKPQLAELEHGDLPPYEILRKMYRTFGMAEMQRGRFQKQVAAEEQALEQGGAEAQARRDVPPAQRADQVAMQLIPIIELCHYCPGMVTALGVSTGLTASTILSKGTLAQKKRWALDLLTLDKIGAWAITEPGSGSDAFGSMQASARRTDGGDYLLNGQKTFITNGPFADTIVFICKLDEGNPSKDRKVLSFVLDQGMEGLAQSKPLRKMGMHSSPTGELFLTDVRVGKDRLLGESETRSYRTGAKDTFHMERTGVVAMALGMVEQCLSLCVDYAKTRIQFGKAIGEFQLVQLKLAKMEVARMNLQNLIFRQIESVAQGHPLSLAEASAGKLYAAQATMEVCLEAVQLFGGNGYMAEFQVEQLARDAKVLQIYAGTDEIQVSQIARDLLGN